MIFKVSNIRKIIESLIFCFIAMLVLNGFIPSIGDYIIIIFIFAFIVLLVLMVKTKNIYLIEEEILTIFEGNEKSNILIRDIVLYVLEHSYHKKIRESYNKK